MKLVRRKAIIQFKQLEEASTHKSEKIHNISTSSFVIPASSVFEISCEKHRQTRRQTEIKTRSPLLQSAWVTKFLPLSNSPILTALKRQLKVELFVKACAIS